MEWFQWKKSSKDGRAEAAGTTMTHSEVSNASEYEHWNQREHTQMRPRTNVSAEMKMEAPYAGAEGAEDKMRSTLAKIPGLRKFHVLQQVGTGGFGQVLLVSSKDDAKQYALKVMEKRHLVEAGSAQYALNEMEAMQDLHHPFLMHMHGAFQDRTHFFYLLQYARGLGSAFVLGS